MLASALLFVVAGWALSPQPPVVLVVPVVPGASVFRGAQGPVESAGPEPVRSAIERALPHLAERTQAWIDQHGCASCHQVPFALWGLNAARAAGFAIDARTPGWNRWSIEKAVTGRSRGDEVWELLLAGADRDAADPAEARAALLALLREARRPDGTWEAAGQLPDQRRPLAEIHDASTAWSRLALRASGASVEGAIGLGESASVEHLALRWLEASGNPGTAPDLALLGARNEDGGWPWLRGEPSDALGTGQALYALAEGLAACEAPSETQAGQARAAIAAAQAYLVRTQGENGGWSAPSTLAKKERASTAVSDDWGTAWALIGLLRSLGVAADGPRD